MTLIYVLLVCVPSLITTCTSNANQVKTLVFSALALAILSLWACRTVETRQIRARGSRIYRPAFLYLAWITLSALISAHWYATFPEVVRSLSYMALGMAALNGMVERRDVDRALLIMVLASIIPSVYGILQHFRIDPIAWVPSSHERVLATFGNPTYFAAYLAFTIPVTLGRLLACSTGAGRMGYGALLGMQQICLVWTFSRGPWIGALFAILLMMVLLAYHGRVRLIRKAWKPLVIAGLFLAVATIAGSYRSGIVQRAASSVDTRDMSNIQRSLQWKAGLRVFKDHPIAGVGPGALKIHMAENLTPAFYKTGIETVSEHAHNEFIEIAADTGIVGLLLFLWIILTGFLITLRAQRQSSQSGDTWSSIHSAALFAGISGLLVCNMGGVSMRYSVGAIYLWLHLGLLASIEILASRRAQRTWNPQDEFVTIELPAIPVSQVKVRRFLVLGVMISMWFVLRPFLAEVQAKQVDRVFASGTVADGEKAISEYLELNPHDVSMLYRLASLQVNTGRANDALLTYKRLQDLSPNYARIHYDLGCLYLNTGRSEDAVRELELASRLDGLPETWEALSRAYESVGKQDQATRAKMKAIQDQGNDAYWVKRVELAEQYIDAGKCREAQDILQKISKERPSEYRVLFDLGLAYDSLGDLPAAEKHYTLAKKSRPKDWGIATNLGAVYYRLGEYEKARVEFERASRMKTGVDAMCNLGLVYWKLGEHKRALIECEKVLKSSPDSPAADRARAVIYRITGEKRL